MEVNVHHAKTHLSKLIQRAEDGEEIIIARDGKPAVKLVPVSGEISTTRFRRLGGLKGKLILPENWEEQWKLIDKELEELMNDAPLVHEPMPEEEPGNTR
jgi:prevent-host-death family protein